MIKDKKNKIYIFNNFKIIYTNMKESYINNFNIFLSVISGFMIVFLIRSMLAIIDTIFVVDEYPVQRFLFIGSTTLMIMGLEVGFTKFIFLIIDKRKPSLGKIFSYFHLLGKYVFGLLMFYFFILLSVLPGFIFLYIKYNGEIINLIYNSIGDPYFQELISSYFSLFDLFILVIIVMIPSIYVSIRLCLWSYFVIDKEMDGYNAIKQSLNLTKTKELELICYFCIILIFNFFGILSLIGICFTIPLTYVFLCQYYRLLSRHLD